MGSYGGGVNDWVIFVCVIFNIDCYESQGLTVYDPDENSVTHLHAIFARTSPNARIPLAPHIGRLLRQMKCLDKTSAGEVCVTDAVLECLQNQLGTSFRSEEMCAGVHKVGVLDSVGDEPLGARRQFVTVTDMETAFRFIPEMFHATIRKEVYWLAGK